MKITNSKQLFCLEHLAAQDDTGREISHAAERQGVNTTKHGSPEWADAPLRRLRQLEMVEHTGEQRHAAKVYRITDKGRAALAASKPEVA